MSKLFCFVLFLTREIISPKGLCAKPYLGNRSHPNCLYLAELEWKSKIGNTVSGIAMSYPNFSIKKGLSCLPAASLAGTVSAIANVPVKVPLPYLCGPHSVTSGCSTWWPG